MVILYFYLTFTQLPHMRKFLSFSDLTKGKLIYFASFAHY